MFGHQVQTTTSSRSLSLNSQKGHHYNVEQSSRYSPVLKNKKTRLWNIFTWEVIIERHERM